MKQRLYLVLSAFLISQVAFADDETKSQNKWLIDFVSAGLESAELIEEESSSLAYKQSIAKRYFFNFKSGEYLFSFSKNLSQNWDVLTSDGTEDLPKIEKSYVSSTITPWTNAKGIGKYSETYQRTLPNWHVFNSLGDLLSSIALYNFESPMNSMFYEDELKLLKKLHKSGNPALQKLWAQFSYDKKGNVTEYSGRYAKKFAESITSNHLVLKNEQGNTCFIESLGNSLDEAISAVRIYKEENEIIVFNDDLNKALHKFASSVFPHPQDVFNDYLVTLSSKTNKALQRFESGIADNE